MLRGARGWRWPKGLAGLAEIRLVSDDQLMKPKDLSRAESALWGAFARGDMVDLRAGDDALDDLGQAVGWGPERTIRAEVVAALLLGACPQQPGRVAAIRIAGARITGTLDISGGNVGVVLWLEGCRLDQKANLREAACKSVDLQGCELNGFDARRLNLTGHLSMQNCVCRGQPVDLADAHVSGIVNLSGTHMLNPAGGALWAGGLSVDGSLFARNGFVAEGEVRLTGAHLSGGLFLQGARLSNPSAEALSGDYITVDRVMACTEGFTAHGAVRLRNAQINGTLSFEGAILAGEKVALSCSGARVERLRLTPSAPMTGTLALGYAQLGNIEDDPRTWPSDIYLNGATYDAIRHPRNQLDVNDRLSWVSRDGLGYRPQPYEQLAAFYRRIGHDDDARRVLLARQRHRRTTLKPLGRAWGHLLDWTVGYGYRPWLAVLWLAILLTAGTATFAIARPLPVAGGPILHFNPFIYTLDLLTPIGVFGLRNAFTPAGGTQWLAYALTAAGWILATTVIAGVTRSIAGR
jgi:hypothetical protein